MLSGLPASGKSTRAKEIVDNGGNFVRVTKDLMRTMLHFDKWNGRNEGITQEAEKALVQALLSQGMNVIIDDTNLGGRHLELWKGIARDAGASFEHVHMDTGITSCILRDELREKRVGADVIIQMALQYGHINGREYVLSDLDGTLANVDHRLHYVKTTPKDWKSFFAGIKDDIFRSDVWESVIGENKPVILVSARPEKYRRETEEWLRKHGIIRGVNYVTLIMRKDGDTRQDDDVKKDMYKRYFQHNKVVRIYDDRPRVIRMWRELGINVVDVGAGVEF